MNNILKKLQKAREIIKKSDLKKAGRNEYSKFDYFTPEQVEQLVDNACKETNTIVLCNLKADEYGLYQTLEFADLESEEKIFFEMRTKHGSITATNETQQMGGTDTYSERYIKMKVFQIKDNNLDFDSQDQRKQEAKQPTKEDKFEKSLVEDLKKEIGALVYDLDPELPKEDYKTFIEETTGEKLTSKNLNEIINKLTIIKEERNK